MNIAFSEPVCDFASAKLERARAVKDRVLKSFRPSYRQTNRECTSVLGTSCDAIDVVFWSFERALVSFSCELVVLEIRYRNRPQNLDIESNAVLLRTLWNAMRAFWSEKKPKIREFEDEIIAFVAMVVQGERTKTAVAKLLNCYDLLRRALIFESFYARRSA